MCLHGGPPVLLDRESAEPLCDLERAADSGRGDVLGLQAGGRATRELDVARVRWKEARQEIEGGRLAGAVRTDQRVQGAVFDGEIYAIDSVNAAEAFYETARQQDRRLARAVATIDLRQFRVFCDLPAGHGRGLDRALAERGDHPCGDADEAGRGEHDKTDEQRSEEHTSELQS